ncbi:MAG TPA: hypothetical protein VNG12_17830 [Acidimicrobiales bacterium]|nr:hypothetical protein [Acidimicrobiales bacterium]
MSSSAVVLALAVFGASAVEAVEALTIVLAAGTSRGWRSAAEGVVAALAVLVVIVAGVGVPLIHLVPIDVLRVVIGGLLLVLGLQWLRKAVLRATGNKALHDEDAIYASTVAELSDGAAPSSTGPAPEGGRRRILSGPRDAVGFTVAFKGVFLEGIEVVLVVLTLGASSNRLGLAAAAAAAAIVVVTAVGFVVARQLSEVPENTMKLAVGIMLTSFGVFWVGEGAGLHWPGSDLAILGLIAWFAAVTGALVLGMDRLSRRSATGGQEHRPGLDVARSEMGDSI